jgi:hypothetical protein
MLEADKPRCYAKAFGKIHAADLAEILVLHNCFLL